MSLYAIKNDEGKYWDEVEETWTTTPCDCWKSKESADEVASEHHSHVVELFEAPAKVVVPAWFDDFVQKYEDNIADEELARFRIIGKICQSGWGITFNNQLNRDVPDNFNPFDLDDDQLHYVNKHKDELVRALSLNSWTVEKSKRYNVKVAHHTKLYYWKWKPNEPGVGSGEDDDVRGVEPYRFTLAEIEHYGLQDCEREEVKQDEN